MNANENSSQEMWVGCVTRTEKLQVKRQVKKSERKAAHILNGLCLVFSLAVVADPG